MADFKLTLEEVCYSELRDKLIELGEEDFIKHTEKQYQVYLREM
jgi:hypothetical protein